MKSPFRLLLWLPLTMASQVSLGAALDLGLKVTGTRAAPPSWQDASGVKLPEVTFDFKARTGVAGSNVDSAPQSVKLVDDFPATGSNLTVTFTSPNSCNIGGEAIGALPFSLVEGSTETANNGTIDFKSNELRTLFMRLPASLSLGDKAGDIVCADAGKMTYTY